MRSTRTSSLIYIGIRGTVIALDRRTGAEQWRTPLKGTEFVNLAMDDNCIYATARGEMFCLDPLSGRILWNNPLKGMGWGIATIAGDSIAPLAAQRAVQAAQAAASG